MIRATPATGEGPARVRMELRNADGSPAEMSGNGIPLPGPGAGAGLAGVGERDKVVIATDAGLRTVTIGQAVGPATLDLSVAMGRPRCRAMRPSGSKAR